MMKSIKIEQIFISGGFLLEVLRFLSSNMQNKDLLYPKYP